MALVAPTLPKPHKMNSGYSMSTSMSDERDTGNGFEVYQPCHPKTRRADKVVYETQEVASTLVAGVGRVGCILLEASPDKSGLES
jgi:hypothetical protein